MTSGVILYNKGEKCVIRMLVMVGSLRTHYSGPITLLAEGPQLDWFIGAIRRMGCSVLYINPTDNVAPLVRKAQLQEWSPYDLSMFLDADTIVLKPIDSYFEKIAQYGFCTGEFADWKTSGKKISGRINAYSSVCSKGEIAAALAYGKATNTGVFGFRKDSEFLAPWKRLTFDSWQAGCSRIPDEVACQLLLPKYRHWLAPVEWGVSVKHGYQPPLKDCIIIHYHGRKHASEYELCNIWKAMFWGFMNDPSNAEARKRILADQHGDRRLKRYLKSIRNDITIVSAVNPPYLEHLKRNLPEWLKTPGLMEHRGILFYNGLSRNELSFVPAHWELIPWDMPTYASQRELMLTSFIIGAARHVKTDYWLKLDADVKPVMGKYSPVGLALPDAAFKADLAGHRWGYTKPGKWLRILEDWYDNTVKGNSLPPRVFTEAQLKEADEQKRYGHARIASFVCLHKSKFIRYIASLCGHRLPVPSHDTLAWYVAQREGMKIEQLNFKSVLTP